MHYYYDNADQFGWGHAVFGGIMMLLVWAVIIGGIVWVVKAISRGNAPTPPAPPPAPRPRNGALETLDLRYAKGELGDDDYRRMRSMLEGNDGI